MLIVFSGTDGAGKSTQISHLAISLQSSGNRVVTLWSRVGYTPGMLMLKRLLRLVARRHVAPPGASLKRTRQFDRRLVSSVWILASLIDLMVFWCLYVRYKRVMGYTVICDRYLDDSRIDLKRNFPSYNVEGNVFWKLLERLVPIPRKSYLLTVPPEVSKERSKMKDEPFPDDDDTLIFRYKEYGSRANFRLEYTWLDGAKTEETVSKEIWRDFTSTS